MIVFKDNRCVDSMFIAQNFTAVSGNYFLSIQTHITAKHRQQAVEWLLDVSLLSFFILRVLFFTLIFYSVFSFVNVFIDFILYISVYFLLTSLHVLFFCY